MTGQYKFDQLTEDEERDMVYSAIAKINERNAAIIVINQQYHYVYIWDSLLSTRSFGDMTELLQAYGSVRAGLHIDYRRQAPYLGSILRNGRDVPHVYYTCTRELSANSRERYDDFYRTWFYQHHMTQLEKQRNNTNANN